MYKPNYHLKSADDYKMSYNEWLQHYSNNKGMYAYILYQNCIITKNGKRTYSQKYENDTTTKNYSIEYSELEDIEQSIMLKIIEYFEKHNNLLYKYKYTMYRQIVINVLKAYVRHIRRFNLSGNEEQKTGWCSGERVRVTSDTYNNSDIRIELLSCLNPQQVKICKMLLLNFRQKEIAQKLKITQQAVSKQLRTIRKQLTAAKIGLQK
jgi:RNA polymerase sigma factor (sigma-70 family)